MTLTYGKVKYGKTLECEISLNVLKIFIPDGSNDDLRLTLRFFYGKFKFVSGLFCYFRFFDVFLVSRGSSFRTYFIFTAAGVVRCGGREMSLRTSS